MAEFTAYFTGDWVPFSQVKIGPNDRGFLVADGVLRTAEDRTILKGVSRGVVFDLARQLNIPVVVEDLQPYDMYTADESFFSSTFPCVLPITTVDGRQIGDGKPGTIT